MKKTIYFLFFAVALCLSSCGGSATNSVKEIAAIIEDGAKRDQAFDAQNEISLKGDSLVVPDIEIADEDAFISPDGNVFKNDAIKKIIEANSSAKLSDDDKATLKAAVEKLYPNATVTDQTTMAGVLSAEIQQTEREMVLTCINEAKTLGDLLK